jgi:uncharacterized protein HemY
MRLIRVIATLVAVGLGPRASQAQVRSVANDEVITTGIVPSASKAVAEWEDALAAGVTDAESWSTIGRRLYDARRYRECIAALERSMLQRDRRSPDDAKLIARAFAKLGNTKQATRWSALGQEIAIPAGAARKATD